MPDNLPTDDEIDQLIADLESLLGTPITDSGDRSDIPQGWDETWQRYDQFVDRPYLSDLN